MSTLNDTSIAIGADDVDNTPSAVVLFYRGEPDSEGRTLDDILKWSDRKLEYNHDFIQILFPLPERSPFNRHAPRLDDITIAAFLADPKLRSGMRQGLARMLKFYGFLFEIINPLSNDPANPERLYNILPDPVGFPVAAQNWMNSHNDLRITRIIRCLRLSGMGDEAMSFYNALKQLYKKRAGYPQRISSQTFMYWKRAATRDLRIPPSMSDSEAEQFLLSHFIQNRH